jgi:acetoin utilization deacetylase AcuC-like enzyme
VLYVSTHQYPFYPGTGELSEEGEGAGRGFTVNLPLPAGCGDAEYAAVYRELVEPIGRAFDPELVLVSAGFDAHADDPLAGMRVTPSGFAHVMASCLAAAEGSAGGRVVVALEGGYDLEGIAASSAAVAGVLMGGSLPDVKTSGLATRLAQGFRKRLGERWGLPERGA